MIRVLLVEDSMTQALQLSALLEEAGFAVEHVKDAEQAFARLAAEPFDLVVSDLVLPGESGFDLCRRIKQTASLARIPVIVLTSQADPANVLRGLEAGADGFMTKRHSPDEIVQRLRRTLAAEALDENVEFQGERFRLAIGASQLRNVLLSAFEDVVDLNAQLAEANRVKDKFLGIAAHDLRSPLTAIQGFTSLLKEGSLGPTTEDQLDACRRIRTSTDTMLSLLSELLDVSALRSGKMELRPMPQSLEPVLRDALDSVALAARDKGIEIQVDAAPDLPKAEFDRQRMVEVIANLLSNAVKFCSRGDRVELRAATFDHRLEIVVEDSGPGIHPDEMSRLFEPFAKLSARPTAGEKSTGLGLSIVKEIVERHGGRVSAESILGQGARFRIELPLRVYRYGD